MLLTVVSALISSKPVLEKSGHRPFSSAEIMQRRERCLVLVRDGEVEGVIDRVEARFANGDRRAVEASLTVEIF